jgi:hypothetical protein
MNPPKRSSAGIDEQRTSGIERAVFGAVARDDIDAWLSRHLRTRLGGDLTHILFRSGRIAAVYGAVLSDGRQVAVKVHRGVADLAYLSAAAACQRRLAMVGYLCPEPLNGPATTDGLTAVIETLCSDGQSGNSHEPSIRRVMAHPVRAARTPARGSGRRPCRRGPRLDPLLTRPMAPTARPDLRLHHHPAGLHLA